jgi:hypothetical protein
MAQPCGVLRYARRPRPRTDAGVSGGDAPREPPAGRRPRLRGSASCATNELEQFEFHRTVADSITTIPASGRQRSRGRVRRCLRRVGTCAQTKLPGSILFIGRRSVVFQFLRAACRSCTVAHRATPRGSAAPAALTPPPSDHSDKRRPPADKSNGVPPSTSLLSIAARPMTGITTANLTQRPFWVRAVKDKKISLHRRCSLPSNGSDAIARA